MHFAENRRWVIVLRNWINLYSISGSCIRRQGSMSQIVNKQFLDEDWYELIFKMAAFLAKRIVNNSLRLSPVTLCITSRLRYFSDQIEKWTNERFDEVVKKDKVVVFMKGIPKQPMCGFSNAVVQILQMHGVESYGSYNVLEDEDLRQRVKEYSNWPTVPQVYVGGEFLGGCDIMLQLHQNGELIEELQKVGIRSLLLEKEEEDKKDS